MKIDQLNFLLPALNCWRKNFIAMLIVQIMLQKEASKHANTELLIDTNMFAATSPKQRKITKCRTSQQQGGRNPGNSKNHMPTLSAHRVERRLDGCMAGYGYMAGWFRIWLILCLIISVCIYAPTTLAVLADLA